MSLLDALLNEPYRDPREIWIAQRADGQRGSGTIDDPYDGGARLGPALEASLAFDQREFLVGTQFEHGLQLNQTVTISISLYPYAATTAAAVFNGTFTVTAIISRLHFIVRFRDGEPLPALPPRVRYLGDSITVGYTPGPGNQNVVLPTTARIYWPVARVTVPPPHGLGNFHGAALEVFNGDARFNGSYAIFGPKDSSSTTFAFRLTFLPAETSIAALPCRVRRLIHCFDDVMRAAPLYSVIHLGPGTFQTRGSAPLYHSHPVDQAQRHVGWFLRAGQRLLGSGMGASTLQLVLPLDEISQTVTVGAAYVPGYANDTELADLTIDANGPNHLAPYGLVPAPVTCGCVGLLGSFIRLHRVRAINFCVQTYAECFGLTIGAPVDGPPPVFNVIEDCIIEQPGENNTHETSVLASVGNEHGNARSPIVRNNYVNCRFTGVSGPPASSELVAVASLTSANENEFTIETKRPHGRVPGQNVVLSRVLLADSSDHPDFNGSFRILSLDPSAPLTKMKCAFPYPRANAASPNYAGAYLGVSFHAPQACCGTGCVTEGNAVHDCLQAFYSDTGSSRDLMVRDNYYSDVGMGVNINYPAATAFGPLQGTAAIVPEVMTVGGTECKCGVFTVLQSARPAVNSTITIREAGAAAPDANNPYHGTGLLVVAHREPVTGHYQFVYRLANQGALPEDNCPGRPVFGLTRAISTAAGSLSYATANQRVTVTTTDDHDLHDGDSVTLAGASLAAFNGFGGPITVTSATQFYFTRNLGASDLSGTGGTVDRLPGISSQASSISYDPAPLKRVTVTVPPGSEHGISNGDFVALVGTILQSPPSNPPTFDGFWGPVTVISSTQFSFPRDMGTSSLAGNSGRFDKHVAAGVVRNGSVATVTTASPHGFFFGQVFKVQGAWVNGSLANGYNGIVTVKSVMKRSFTYDMKPVAGSIPDGSTSPAGPIEFAAHWDIRRFALENNIYDLYALDGNSAIVPRGVSMAGLNPEDTPPYLFPALLFRENLIRHADGLPSPAQGGSFGLYVTTVGNAIVEQNVAALGNPRLLNYYDSGNLTHLQNLNANGTPVHGYDITNQHLNDIRELEDIETRIQDALTMALL